MDKDTIRVASIAMHSVMGDPSANLRRVAEWAHKAHAQGANFGIFPEECITGSMNKSDLTFEEARKIAADGSGGIGAISRIPLPQITDDACSGYD